MMGMGCHEEHLEVCLCMCAWLVGPRVLDYCTPHAKGARKKRSDYDLNPMIYSCMESVENLVLQ